MECVKGFTANRQYGIAESLVAMTASSGILIKTNIYVTTLNHTDIKRPNVPASRLYYYRRASLKGQILLPSNTCQQGCLLLNYSDAFLVIFLRSALFAYIFLLCLVFSVNYMYIV